MCYVSFVIKATFHNISAKGRRTDSARLYCLLKYYFNIFFSLLFRIRSRSKYNTEPSKSRGKFHQLKKKCLKCSVNSSVAPPPLNSAWKMSSIWHLPWHLKLRRRWQVLDQMWLCPRNLIMQQTSRKARKRPR